MGWSDQARSRLVRTLKVAMPLAALLLLSLLFLLWDGRDPQRALPYSEVDIEALLRQPRMTAPTYSGVTSDGAAIRLSATSANPATSGPVSSAANAELSITAADGTRVTASAAEALVNTDSQTVVLSGGFFVETDLGYRFEGETVMALLDRTRVASDLPIVAQGPQGEITAGAFTLERAPEGGHEVIHFKQGVKLIYQPKFLQAVP